MVSISIEQAEMLASFELIVRANSVVSQYLLNCYFDGEQYQLIEHDWDLEWMADRLTGAWWAYQEQQKSINFLKAKLENEKIAVDHYKDRVEFMEKRLERQAQTIALLQGRKTRAEAAKDFDDAYE